MWIAVIFFVSLANPEDVAMIRLETMFNSEMECQSYLPVAANMAAPYPSHAHGYCWDMAKYFKAV